MYNVILPDFAKGQDWPFLQEIKKEVGGEWDVLYSHNTPISHKSKVSNFVRLLDYFILPLKLIKKYTSFNNIVAYQQFYGLNLAFWLRLFGIKKKGTLTVMTFIYKPKHGILGKIYNQYMRYVVSSKYIDRFVVFSKGEIAHYSRYFNIPQEKFSFVPLGIGAKFDDYIVEKGDYIFSTGRSNRDFDFLYNAMKDSDMKTIIACDTCSLPSVNNLTILNDCKGESMLEMLSKCFCVIIPLKDIHISAGQLVILQSMALGKPIIVTRSDGVRDYVTDGETGIFIDNSKEELLSVIERLQNEEEFYLHISENEKKCFSSNHTIEQMGRNVGKIVKDILLKNNTYYG